MTAPNIAGLTTVKGKSVGVNLNSVNETDLLVNASNSHEVLKINSVVISNIHGTNSATISVMLNKTVSAGSPALFYHLAKTVTVPANATLVVVSKDTQLYLEENNSIVIQASAANHLQAICSYEEIA